MKISVKPQSREAEGCDVPCWQRPPFHRPVGQSGLVLRTQQELWSSRLAFSVAFPERS